MLAVLSFTTIRNSLHTCATVKQSCYLVDPDSCLAFRVYTFQLISLTVWYSSCRYHTDITTLSFLCAPTTFQHSAHQSTRLELNHINQHAKHLLNFGQQHILLLPIRVHTFVSTYFDLLLLRVHHIRVKHAKMAMAVLVKYSSVLHYAKGIKRLLPTTFQPSLIT